MGWLLGKSNARTPHDTALMTNSSLQGMAIPLVFGQRRVPINLIWYDNFVAHRQPSSGKGGLGGGKSGGGTYTYTASFQAALGIGEISGVSAIWRDKAKLSVDGSVLVGTFGTNTVSVSAGVNSPVPAGQTFIANLGVTLSGVPLVPNKPTNSYRVSSSGVYTFTADLIGSLVEITYYYSQQDNLSASGFSIFNGGTSQTAWSYLTSNYPDKALNYRGLAYLAAVDYDLGQSSALPNINAEVIGLLAGTVAGHLDSIPADVAAYLLSDSENGIGFPSSHLGTLENWRTYCKAQNLLMSPSYDAQQDASSMLDDLATFSNSSWAIVDGLLEVVPYGDEAVTGNGVTYTPPLAPEYDLDDDAFVFADGEDPVELHRTRKTDQSNSLVMEFNNRTMDYARDIAQAKDQASIDTFGPNPAATQTGHMYCDPGMAQTAAQLLLQRQQVPGTYSFRLGWQYIDLDVMDLVTITDTRLELNRQWVRITDIEEDDQGTLRITAEKYLAGTGAPALYSYDLTNGLIPNFAVDPGPNNNPVFFEPPIAVSKSGKMEVCMALSGQTALWQGADCYVSFDGNTYAFVARIPSSARHGLLTDTLANVADPDETSQLMIALATNGGALISGSQTDADLFHTLCWVDGELISYETATLLAPVTDVGGVPMFGNAYALTYLRRGVYATSPSAHATATPFVRFDDDVLQIPITAEQIGSQINVKVLPYNIYGGGQPTLDVVAAYSYTVTGAGWLYPLDDVTNLSSTADNTLHWTPVSDPYRTLDYEVRIGATFSGGTSFGYTPLTKFDFTVSGKYWIRAHSRSPQGVDVFSEDPVSLDVVYMGPAPFVFVTYDQVFEAWPGTVTGGCSIVGADLILDSSAGLTGDYTFDNTDTAVLPSLQSAFINFEYTVTAGTTITDIFALADIFASDDFFGGEPASSSEFIPQISLSDDGVTFGAFQNWRPGGIYQFKAARFRVLLASSTTDVNITVSALTVTISLPQRIDSYEVTTNAGGPAVTITYDNPGPFVNGPTLSGTIMNAQAGDTLVIVPGTPATDTSTVDVQNTGVSVARDVHVNAVGN